MTRLLRWYHTVRHLKAVQVWWRLWRPFAIRLSKRRSARPPDISYALSWPAIPLASLVVPSSYRVDKRQFVFLNQRKFFYSFIHWDYPGHGLLWAYNLNYFEWLYDDSLSIGDRLQTVQDFISTPEPRRIGLHAYPASLRIASWIRFLLRYEIKDGAILRQLFSDADWLSRFPEYHLDGNHLLENAIALSCAGLYFRNHSFYKKGTGLLRRCIAEQILADGGHVEGSPMYHSLLLWRLMQCLELLHALGPADEGLEKLLTQTASKMLGWMAAMTFSDGTWPQFNDCTPGVAPDTAELLRYAALLRIEPSEIHLHESGYRMIRAGHFELAVDVAPVAPAHQPGHTHADIGNFCLHYKGVPIIVDTGISTYETTRRRSHERSTAAHNTVAIDDRNSSEVWKSFRVGRRVRTLDLLEADNSISISYTGYFSPGIIQKRTFSWNDHQISISDERSETTGIAAAMLHFHPCIHPALHGDNKIVADGLIFLYDGCQKTILRDYNFATGYNMLESSKSAAFCFVKHLTMSISERLVD